MPGYCEPSPPASMATPGPVLETAPETTPRFEACSAQSASSPGLVDRGGGQCQPLGEMASSGVGGETNVGQVLPGMLGQVSGKADRQLLQCLGTLGRKGQQVQGTLAAHSLTGRLTAAVSRGGHAGRQRGLFEDHVGVGAADAQRVDGRPARRGSPAGHGRHSVLTKKGVFGEVDGRVGAAEMEARRQRLVLQGQGRLDQPGHAGGRLQVAEVGLHRADGAELLVFGVPRRKALVSAEDLHRVAHRRGRAVGLDVADRAGLDLGHGQGVGAGGGLAVGAGGPVAQLGGAVVVDGRAADHGVDVVAVARRPAGSGFSSTRPAPLPKSVPLASASKARQWPSGESRAWLEWKIAHAVRHADGDAAGQGHVALAGQQALAGQVDRHQRGGAGGLHGEARPAEVQLVGDPRGEIVLVVADALHAAGGADQPAVDVQAARAGSCSSARRRRRRRRSSPR